METLIESEENKEVLALYGGGGRYVLSQEIQKGKSNT